MLIAVPVEVMAATAAQVVIVHLMTKHIRVLLLLKYHFHRLIQAFQLRLEPFHPIQGFLRKSEIEDHDVMKMAVVAPAVVAEKAEKLVNRLVAVNRMSKVQQDLLGQDGPPRFVNYLDGNRRPSPHPTAPHEETKTEKSTVIVFETHSAKS